MGRKLDALLGRRRSKPSNLNALLALTISRIAILKNRRNVRCANASDDIAALLQHNHLERAVLRAEYVIKEQNMVDVFTMVESYCNLLIERSILLEHNHRECPFELKEAVSSLVFMASRSGELLELQDIRSIFASWYGHEFVASSVELRSGCPVNTKIVQKMSTRQPDLESRLKVVKDIASDKGLPFNLENASPKNSPAEKEEEETHKESSNSNKGPSPSLLPVSPATTHSTPDLQENGEATSSTELKDMFCDATSAAQAAFESAAYAAAAARAAVELSRSGSHGKWPRDHTRQQQIGINLMAERSHLDGSPRLDHGITSVEEEEEERKPTDRKGAHGKEVAASDASEEEGVDSERETGRSGDEEKIKGPHKPSSVRTRRGGL